MGKYAIRFYCWKDNIGLYPEVGKYGMFYRCRYWHYAYRPVGMKPCTFSISVAVMTDIMDEIEKQADNGELYIGKIIEYPRYICRISRVAEDLIAVKIKEKHRNGD